MSATVRYLHPSEASARLGVSVKALRLYEQRGLIAPCRTENGWRVYGPDDMNRAAEVIALRGLGLSLACVKRLLDGKDVNPAAALASHQSALEGDIRRLVAMVAKVRDYRIGLASEPVSAGEERGPPVATASGIRVAFELPWPWGGEWFHLRDVRALNYITTLSEIGMLEQGLDQATQIALISRLRRRGPGARPLFLLTRSCAVLDLSAVGPDETITYCPANQSPPIRVKPHHGAPGYEAVASCLASPDVRARTQGVIAWRPRAASPRYPSPGACSRVYGSGSLIMKKRSAVSASSRKPSRS